MFPLSAQKTALVACVFAMGASVALLGCSRKDATDAAATFDAFTHRADAPTPQALTKNHFFAGTPTIRNGGSVASFHHAAYSIGYSEPRRTPIWSCYATFRTDQVGASFGKHRPRWQPEAGSRAGVQPSAIQGLPWHNGDDPALLMVEVDKGHLTPLADIAYRYGLTAAEETFRMTNVVPQLAANNRGPWELLEASLSGTNHNGRYVQGLVDVVGTMWVTTGPVFGKTPTWANGNAALPSGIPIHEAMFKVVITGSQDAPRVLCFIMPNEDLPKTPDTCRAAIVTLDEVEQRTGLNLFPDLSPQARATLGGRSRLEDQWRIPDALNGRHRPTRRHD